MREKAYQTTISFTTRFGVIGAGCSIELLVDRAKKSTLPF